MTDNYWPNRGDVIASQSKGMLKYWLALTCREHNESTQSVVGCLLSDNNQNPNLSVRLSVLEQTMFARSNRIYTIGTTGCEFVCQVNLAKLHQVQLKLAQLIGADIALNSLIQK